jgi:hypothetical protein
MANAHPVVRISRGTFDPARLADVEQMTRDTGEFLMPAIRALPGLLAYYACVAPEGSLAHVSLWDTDEHADQMGALKEMVVDARAAAEAAGVVFAPIVNHPIVWQL